MLFLETEKNMFLEDARLPLFPPLKGEVYHLCANTTLSILTQTVAAN